VVGSWSLRDLEVALITYLDRVMREAAYGLLRIPLPRTLVNKGLTSWGQRPVYKTLSRSTLERGAGFLRTYYLGASGVAEVGDAAGAAPLGCALFEALLRSA